MSNYWDNKGSGVQNQFNAQAGIVADGLQQFMTQTFTWMALGLALTGFVSILTVSNEMLLGMIFGTPFVFYALIIGELLLVMAFGVALRKQASFPVLLAMFLAYSAINGLTLSVVLLAYTMESVGTTFFVTAGMFGGLALYGYVTKKDLAGMGRIAGMAVWGLLLVMIVNIFMGSSLLSMGIGALGVLIFSALTAYDVQKLKSYYEAHSNNQDSLNSGSLGGALMLYLDFINLFLMLLRLLGNRK